MIEARYLPVPVRLEPRERVDSKFSVSAVQYQRLISVISDQGILRVELLTGHEIRGVDRGGRFFSIQCRNYSPIEFVLQENPILMLSSP